MKKLIVAIMVVILSIGLVGCSSKEKKTEQSKPEVTFGDLKVMPEFKCKDTNDKDITNDVFKDKKLTMINIWGTFCSPCIEEMPELQEIYKEMQGKGVNILGVVADGVENEIAALDIIRKTGVKYQNIIPNQKFIDDFVSKTDVIPVTVFVNSNGEIVGEVVVGAKSKGEYNKIIDGILKNMK